MDTIHLHNKRQFMEQGADCENCPLRNCKPVPAAIPLNANLIVIGESPGIEEASARVPAPFIGQSGQLLKTVVKQKGGDPDRLHLTNVVMCMPPNISMREGRTPEKVKELVERAAFHCKDRLFNELSDSPAPTILALGRFAGEHMKAQSTPLEGNSIWHQWNFGNKHVIATNHTAYILRRPHEIGMMTREIGKAIKGPVDHILQHRPRKIDIVTVNQLESALAVIADGAKVAFDIETQQVWWFDREGKPADRILMLGITAWLDRGYVVAPHLLDDPTVVAMLNAFFKRVRPYAQNGRFDKLFLMHQKGIEVELHFDTMLAHYCLDEVPGRHGLKELARKFFDVPDYEASLVKKYLHSKEDTYDKIPYEELAQYLVWDCTCTLGLGIHFEKLLRKEGLYEWPFQNVLMREDRALTRAEYRGIQIDKEYLERMQGVLNHELDLLVHELRRISGKPELNPGSPVQVAKVLFEDRGLPRPNTIDKSKKPNQTDAKTLKYLINAKPIDEFVDMLFKYRRVAKIRNSYIDNFLGLKTRAKPNKKGVMPAPKGDKWWGFIDTNNRVHGRYVIPGTLTGRIAIRNPAVQTIPEPFERYGKMIRGAFIAKPGHKLVVADYSQAELRVLAHVTGEQYLLDSFNKGLDLHTAATLRIWTIEREGQYYRLDEPDVQVYPDKRPDGTEDLWFKQRRAWTKTSVFAAMYGGKPESLRNSRGFPQHMAKAFIDGFYSVFREMTVWQKEQERLMKTQGYIQSTFGRKRRFPFINHANSNDARKASVNMPIQSAASDLTLLAAAQLEEEGWEVVLTVHDSILLEVEESRAEEAAKRIKEVMVGNGEKWFGRVVWKVDVDIEDRWAEPPTEDFNPALIALEDAEEGEFHREQEPETVMTRQGEEIIINDEVGDELTLTLTKVKEAA